MGITEVFMNRMKNFWRILITVLCLSAIFTAMVACSRNNDDKSISSPLGDELMGTYYKNGTEDTWFKFDSSGWTDSNGKSGSVTVEKGIISCYDGDEIIYNATISGNGLSVVSTATGEILNYVKNADASHEHDYGEWIITLQPTCTEKGSRKQVCNGCGVEVIEELDSLGHTYDYVAGITPTCMGAGNLEHRKCSLCGLKFNMTDDTVLTDVSLPSVKHNFVGDTCTECGADKNAADKYIRVGDDGMPSVNGNYILFGSYPQTKISNAETISELNSLAGQFPTISNRQSWSSYGYFADGSAKEYMWYIDVTLDEEKYRGVYFLNYRPYYAEYSSSENNSNQDDNGYFTGNVYWFKYEAIKWRIITSDESTATLICQSVIDSREINTSLESTLTNAGTVYASNWEYSTARNWLNTVFLNTAFTTAQKKIIIPTDVDNKNTAFDGVNNKHAVNQRNTLDNVYIPAFSEILGYDFTKTNPGYADEAKMRVASDYAKALGVYVDVSGYSNWWLRSPHSDSGSVTMQVDSEGYVYGSYSVNHTSSGIVPTLKLRICPNHYPDENCYCSECGVTEHDLSSKCVCSKCGMTVHTIHDCVCIACGTEIHDLIRHAYLAPYCETLGHNEYWECKDCGGLFGDAAGGKILNGVPIISALGHSVEDCVCTRCKEALHNFVNCICTICKETDHDMEDCKCLKCGHVEHIGIGEYCKHDNAIYFGTYPQTEITDTLLKSTLNAKAGNLPTVAYSQGWTPFEFYVNANKANAYMWYTDVEHEGEKYRGVYFISYRPSEITNGSLPDYSNQDDNGYLKNAVYWFVYEPVKWTILTENGGEMLLLCESAIDGMEYFADIKDRDGLYAVDWEHSFIRSWLNETFMETAFTELQKELISAVTLNNKTTAQGGSGNIYATSQNDTTDNIFLMSYADMIINDYGFGKETASDTARVKTPTAYARAMGASSIWRLRSAYDETNTACVDIDGGIDIKRLTNDTSCGIVPALWITFCTNHTPNADCTCTKCGTAVHVLEGGKCVECGRVVYVRGDSDGKENANGQYLYFGTYPQTSVTNSSLITSLNSMSGTLPTPENNRKWIPYGYYVRNVTSNYMWYIDIEKDGEKYRGVYFVGYRPSSTTFNSSADTSEQNENGYTPAKAFWFKYEDIKWKILSEENGVALIFADLMIDSREYQAVYSETEGVYYTTYGSAPEGTLSNNWEYSTIREWLNESFYETAFGVFQRQLIELTYNSDVLTYDNVYLLSMDEANNPINGFSPITTDEDKQLIKNATEYAKAQGIYLYHDISKELISGQWWLRTADERTSYAKRVSLGGGIVGDDVTYTNVGIVPAMRVVLCDGHETVDCVCVKCGLEVHETNENCECVLCGTTEHILFDCECVLCGTIEHTPDNCVCKECGLTAHTLKKHAEIPATCDSIGQKEYYECETCGKLFADKDAKNLITDITLSAVGHVTDDKGTCVICSAQNVKPHQRVNANGEPDANGNYFFFGSYPQNIVEDDALVSSLNSLAGRLPTTENSNGWTSYNFYDNGVVSDYTWYKDVVENGLKYRGVYFTKYRASVISEIVGTESGNQKSNGYETGIVYWFAYSALKWRMIDETQGKVTVVCESSIDSMNYSTVLTGTNNDWNTSFVRTYLNGSFYDTAFGDLQKELVSETVLNNSDTSFMEPNESYVESTDKVFLLSYADIFNGEYGFGTEVNLADVTKVRNNTDYAYAMGAYMTPNGKFGGALWLLRSYMGSGAVSGVNNEGRVNDGYVYGTNYTGYGIVPALRFDLCLNHNFVDCVCTTCGSEKHAVVKVEHRDENCTEHGNIEHFLCNDCGEKFLDEKCKQPIDEVIIYAHGHKYVLNICSVCYTEATKREKYWRVDKDNIESNIGVYIYFGEFPQTLKQDNVIITEEKDRRGYYLGNDGEYYAKVMAQPNGEYAFENGVNATVGTVYYFKVEPLKWRIISETTDRMILICESIIDSGIYDGDTNNYENSDLRSWLNGWFYENAFNSYQKALVLDTLVSNSANTTASVTNPNAGTTTSDKVFMASYSEMINSTYGFSSGRTDIVEESDGYYKRSKCVSDYALAKGCYVDDDGNGWWWLRSPYSENTESVSVVEPDGDIYEYRGIYKENTGIVPMISIKLP